MTNECVNCSKPLSKTRSDNQRCGTCITRDRRLRFKLNAIATLGATCIICRAQGKDIPFVFVDRTDKKTVVYMSRFHDRSWSIYLSEALKTELLCLDCHSSN